MRNLIAVAAMLCAVTAAAVHDPASQAEVWKTEEAFVAAQLEHLNEALALGKSMRENWKDVPGDSRAVFELSQDQALAARKRLRDVGVIDDKYVFALEGRAPTLEQTTAFLTFRGRTFQMIQASKGLYKELGEDARRSEPLAPPALTAAYRAFNAFNLGVVRRLAPLNDKLIAAMNEGYVSRWNLWDQP